jgi:hypothetical protein
MRQSGGLRRMQTTSIILRCVRLSALWNEADIIQDPHNLRIKAHTALGSV